MDKTTNSELSRIFLIEHLPYPLTPASPHLQLFDNYIADTRLRLRSIRDPSEKSWTRIMQQRTRLPDGTSSLAEIYLNDAEYAVFERHEGREIRKNRYFHEMDGQNVIFDVYLGGLWGLKTAAVGFTDSAYFYRYSPASFMIFEVTQLPFFFGENLVTAAFSDVQNEITQLLPAADVTLEHGN